MNPVLANTLVEILSDDGVEAQIYENYSGRGMFGKTTTGIVIDCQIGDVLALVIQEALNADSSRFNDISTENESNQGEHVNMEELVSPLDITGISSDNMGLNTILY